ncbi:hypothetical protein BH11PSE11_BH11PSE11_12680 [soil metagenome]
MNRHNKGFSLIEIMIAIAIGVLSMVVMLQIFSNSEAQKRTATGTSDAQTNGATGLYLIERDLKMAGWGLSPTMYMGTQLKPVSTIPVPRPEEGCNNLRSYCNGTAACGTTDPNGTNFSFAAVRIEEGAAGAPDKITARYFADPTDDRVILPSLAAYMSDTGTEMEATSAKNCASGDLVLISDPTPPAPPALAGNCTLMQLSAAPVPPAAPAGAKYPHANAVPYNSGLPWPANPLFAPPTSKALVACFKHPANGPAYERIFSIHPVEKNLLKTDNVPTPPIVDEVVASGIVDIQAQYGLAGDQSQNVISWVNASAPWDNPKPKTPTNPYISGSITAGRLQNIKAVRIALLARSAQFEKPDPATGLCNTTTDAMIAGWPKWNGVAVFQNPALPANWRCYRYKAFETLVPLRNVIWGNI